MLTEKRSGQKPIPDNYFEMLSNEQLETIQKQETFGGKLWFIRRPNLGDIVTVIKCSDHEDCLYAVIEIDGSLNKNHGLTIREH